MILRIGALVLLVFFSAFFSGSETALMALNKLKLKHQAREGRKGAKVLEGILRRPDNLIGTILLGNNLVNVAGSAIAASLAISVWGEELGILYATVVMTLVLLIFAEITPKTYAAYHSEGVAYLVSRPLRFLMALLKPLVLAVTFFTNGILRMLGMRRRKGEVFTEEELKTMILLGEEAGFIERKRKRMLNGVLELGDISVKDVMTPRTEIFAVDLEEPAEDVKKKLLSSPYSRVPLYRGNIERIVGVLLIKDFLKALASGREPKIEEMMTEPYFIPESKRIQEQLTDFQKKRVHMAIIIDEFGGIEGLVTMEDLLEEIVGEIWDEYDKWLVPVVRHRDGSLTVDGKLTIRDLSRELGVELPEEEFNTVAGLILHGLGRIPVKGESCDYMGFRFTAQKVVGQAVKRVRIKEIGERG